LESRTQTLSRILSVIHVELIEYLGVLIRVIEDL